MNNRINHIVTAGHNGKTQISIVPPTVSYCVYCGEKDEGEMIERLNEVIVK